MDSSSGCGSTSTRIIARCSSLRKALATMRSKRASSGSYADSEDRVADHAHEAAAPAAVDQRYAVLRERPAEPDGAGCGRSEEHTSELQSLTNLVCRLLLEK